jgi:hypothetical protein
MRDNGADVGVVFYEKIMGSSIKTTGGGVIFPLRLAMLDKVAKYNVFEVASVDCGYWRWLIG